MTVDELEKLQFIAAEKARQVFICAFDYYLAAVGFKGCRIEPSPS